MVKRPRTVSTGGSHALYFWLPSFALPAVKTLARVNAYRIFPSGQNDLPTDNPATTLRPAKANVSRPTMVTLAKSDVVFSGVAFLSLVSILKVTILTSSTLPESACS